MKTLRYCVVGLAGYLLGALPIGIIVGRLIKGIDLRDYGSGKMGATNALRTLGRGPAALVLAGDLGKGAAAIGVARAIAPGDPVAEVLAGGAAATGHSWSVFIRWGGGRSVLVSAATLIMLCPPVAAIAALVGGTTIALSRYVSLGSIMGSASAPLIIAPFVARGRYPRAYLVYCIVLGSFIVARHHDNIGHLLSGTERKLGQKAERLGPEDDRQINPHGQETDG